MRTGGTGSDLVSVALPVHRIGPHFEGALRSILAQSHRELDVMVIVNPGDDATADAALSVSGGDARVRVLHRPRPGLAAALNLGLREARSEIVARMDSDDWSAPERIAVQLAALQSDPKLDAVGSAFAVIDAEMGEEIERLHPPVRPEEMRWRLLLGNPIAHGSMVLRRSAVRAAGGYDESIERGQDYALWVRMAAKGKRIGTVPEVVYRHRMHRDRLGVSAGDDAQARTVASVMVEAWASLGATKRRADIEAAVAGVARGSMTPGAGMGAIAAILESEGPTREGMTAWLWCRDRAATGQWPAIEAGRRARVREVGRALREAGIDRVWLWGAGLHTRWMVDHRGDLGIPLAGIVDDHRVGEAIGEFTVSAAEGIGAGESALISSDTAEDVLWRAAGGARARGVRVWRIYGEEASAFGR